MTSLSCFTSRPRAATDVAIWQRNGKCVIRTVLLDTSCMVSFSVKEVPPRSDHVCTAGKCWGDQIVEKNQADIPHTWASDTFLTSLPMVIELRFWRYFRSSACVSIFRRFARQTFTSCARSVSLLRNLWKMYWTKLIRRYRDIPGTGSEDQCILGRLKAWSLGQ